MNDEFVGPDCDHNGLSKFNCEYCCEDTGNADRLDWLDQWATKLVRGLPRVSSKTVRYNLDVASLPKINSDLFAEFDATLESVFVKATKVASVQCNDTRDDTRDDTSCMIALRKELFCRLLQSGKIVGPENFARLMATSCPLDYVESPIVDEMARIDQATFARV
jgi:hypothetical protein